MAKTLREWAKEMGLDVSWDSGTNQVQIGNIGVPSGGTNTVGFHSGSGSNMGLSYDPSGTHYVQDENALRNALGLAPMQQQQQPQVQAPQQQSFSYNPTQRIDDLYSQERQARLLALQNQLRGQTDALSRQQMGLTPGFQQERVNADTSAQMAGKRLAEFMAAQGLGRSGENVQGNIAIQTARQGALSDIGQREGAANADISQRIADLSVANQGDIAQMEAALAADKTRSMIDAGYKDRDFEYQKYMDELANSKWVQEFNYRQGRDEVSDSRYTQEQQWQIDPNNPAYQRQLIDLEIQRLNASALPEQQKLELQRLRQQITAGSIDINTAAERLNQLKAGGTVTSGMTQAEVSSTAKEYVAHLLKIKPPVDSTLPYADEQQLTWENNAKLYVANLRQSGVPEDVVIEAMRLLGLKISYAELPKTSAGGTNTTK